MRTRTAGDCTFVARACGIPQADAAAMDRTLLSEVDALFGGGVAGKRTFVRTADGGLGFHSLELSSPCAYAASWHMCLPTVLKRLGLPAASALVAVSPWAAQCLPVAEAALRAAVRDESVSIGDESVAASQHQLAKAPLAAAVREISGAVAIDNKASAALRSAGGPGAGVWTNAPSRPNQHLSDAQLAIAVRTRLHLALPQCTGQCQHRRRDGTLCGATLDEKGFHARCCPIGGWLLKRHDAACAVLAEWCGHAMPRGAGPEELG